MTAEQVIERCRALAQLSEEPGVTTRTFLSQPMHQVHAKVRNWMEQAGMTVSIDPVGNIRGLYPSALSSAPRLYIGSHLDTVPNAGAFDGILGVVLGIALVERLAGRRPSFAIEVLGFSEEEGVRFGVPFIGSRAFTGDIDNHLLAKIGEAIETFGLDPSRVGEARAASDALGYLEFHIEQGPVLESLDLPLGIVETISGQSRFEVVFEGRVNHAGTTPMHLRHDALAGAAEWIGMVERAARAIPGAVATVGYIDVSPGASNVIAGLARTSLDIRHVDDEIRHDLVNHLLECSKQIAANRCLTVSYEQRLDQSAVAMDPILTQQLERAVESAGYPIHRMPSGAGHDAMIVARRMPAAMLFLRSPGGISHHPDESVLAQDVAAALDAGTRFLDQLEPRRA
jgi:allantoate deiminase